MAFSPRRPIRLRRPRWMIPPLRVADILRWADRFYARMRRWPTCRDGAIPATNETWMGVQSALKTGSRGLPSGSTLARLLAEHRGYRNIADLPPLTVRQILTWADAFRAATGQWPTMYSGLVAGTASETWHRVDSALRRGIRGLPGRCSLARLLAKHRGVQNMTNRPRFTEARIVRWAKRHRRRTGRWPTEGCGAVADAPGETWQRVDRSLRVGVRGLPGGSSLAQLLARHCGVRNNGGLPAFSIGRILRWADAHHRRTGRWPQANTGAIPEAPGDSWQAVHAALSKGRRGLPGGTSLAWLLEEHRGVRHPQDRRRFTVAEVRAWAQAHLARTGEWPTAVGEPVPEAPDLTWKRVNRGLRERLRGKTSLYRLCPKHCRRSLRSRAKASMRNGTAQTPRPGKGDAKARSRSGIR